MIVTDQTKLRLACTPVKDVKEGGEIARKLSAELDKVNKKAVKDSKRRLATTPRVIGIGLAAPQIGLSRKVCILRPYGKPYVLMNPVIVNHSAERIPFTEGCLSQPGESFQTYRYIWVEVDTLNLGRLSFGPRSPGEFSQNELLKSVVAQHEIAHLAGKLASDFTNETYPEPSEWETWNPIAA